MNIDTQSHLATLRALLVYRRTGLRADVHAADIAARERDDSATGEVSDRLA